MIENKIKKHNMLILDDEDSIETGWGRVIDLYLKKKHYVLESFKAEITEKESLININNIDVHFYNPIRGIMNFDNICDLVYLEKTKKNTDIYFIDIDWKSELANNNSTKLVDKKIEDEDLTFEDLNNGKIPQHIAGLYLLNELPKDSKPKIIFSGSDRTKLLLKYLYLFKNRLLTEDILIGELKINSDQNYIEDIDNKVQDYLLKKQIKILNYTTADIKEKLTTALSDDQSTDDILIPDYESKDENWILRTLFPNIINKIEENIDKEENINYLKEVINNLNFRMLYKWLMFEHGNIEGKVLKNENEDIVKFRFDNINYVESDTFITVSNKSKDFYYFYCEQIMPIINSLLLNEDSNLKNALILAIKDHYFRENLAKILPIQNLVLTRIENDLPDKDFINYGDIIKMIAEFGIYIGDIYFTLKCIESNNDANKATGEPKLKIIKNNNEKLAVIEIIPNTTDYNFLNSNLSHILVNMKNSIVEGMTNKNLIILEQQNMKDYSQIFIKRYNALVEIQMGRYILNNKKENRFEIIENNEIEKKINFKFTINSI